MGLFYGVIQPLGGGRFNIVSPNQPLLRNLVEVSYDEEALGAQFFYDALRQSGARQGNNFVFNGYQLRPGLNYSASYGRFLNDFMTFGGGYAYEDRQCRINFVAARGLFYDNYADIIEDDLQDLFEIDITTKEGAVRNDVSGEIVLPTSIVRALVRTYTETIDAGSFKQLYYAVPEGKVASNWSIRLTAPNPVPEGVSFLIIDESNSDITFVLANGSPQSADISAELYVSTYEVAQRDRLSEVRIDSVLAYGRQPFEDFPDWAGDAGPVQNELNRLKDPLSVCRLRLPIVPDDARSPFGNDVLWAFFDVGKILRIQDGPFSKDMMIGRIVVDSIDTFEIEWHLVEVPTSKSVTDVEVPAWYADNQDNILGINTYLTDEVFTTGNFLTVAGEFFTLTGHNIIIPSLELFALAGDYFTLGGSPIKLGASNGS